MLEGRKREGRIKKNEDMGRTGRLPGETEDLGYLSHLDSQKSGGSRMCNSGKKKSTAEFVVEDLRCMVRISSLRIY